MEAVGSGWAWRVRWAGGMEGSFRTRDVLMLAFCDDGSPVVPPKSSASSCAASASANPTEAAPGADSTGAPKRDALPSGRADALEVSLPVQPAPTAEAAESRDLPSELRTDLTTGATSARGAATRSGAASARAALSPAAAAVGSNHERMPAEAPGAAEARWAGDAATDAGHGGVRLAAEDMANPFAVAASRPPLTLARAMQVFRFTWPSLLCHLFSYTYVCMYVYICTHTHTRTSTYIRALMCTQAKRCWRSPALDTCTGPAGLLPPPA